MYEILADSHSGSKDDPIPLGRAHENDVRVVKFVLDEPRQLGEGSWVILVQDPYTNETRQVSIEDTWEENGFACWSVGNQYLDTPGYGLIQLLYTPSSYPEHLYKSKLWNTYISDSLRGA